MYQPCVPVLFRVSGPVTYREPAQTVVVALSQARNVDERAISQIAKTISTGSTCYARAANQHIGAAASYNAWISDMVASIQPLVRLSMVR